MYLCPDMEYLLRRRNPQVYCSAGTSTNWGRKFFWTIGLGEERGDKVINERARPKSRTCTKIAFRSQKVRTALVLGSHVEAISTKSPKNDF